MPTEQTATKGTGTYPNKTRTEQANLLTPDNKFANSIIIIFRNYHEMMSKIEGKEKAPEGA